MAATGSYTTASGKSITALLNRYAGFVQDDLGAILYQEGEGIITQAKGLVPVDTGTLQSSGYTAEPRREGDIIRVELGFGGPAAKINPVTEESSEGYALYVHENLEAFHPSGGIALYLEIPFRDAKRAMTSRIARGLRERGAARAKLFAGYGSTMTSALGEVADGPA